MHRGHYPARQSFVNRVDRHRALMEALEENRRAHEELVCHDGAVIATKQQDRMVTVSNDHGAIREEPLRTGGSHKAVEDESSSGTSAELWQQVNRLRAGYSKPMPSTRSSPRRWRRVNSAADPRSGSPTASTTQLMDELILCKATIKQQQEVIDRFSRPTLESHKLPATSEAIVGVEPRGPRSISPYPTAEEAAATANRLQRQNAQLTEENSALRQALAQTEARLAAAEAAAAAAPPQPVHAEPDALAVTRSENRTLKRRIAELEEKLEDANERAKDVTESCAKTMAAAETKAAAMEAKAAVLQDVAAQQQQQNAATLAVATAMANTAATTPVKAPVNVKAVAVPPSASSPQKVTANAKRPPPSVASQPTMPFSVRVSRCSGLIGRDDPADGSKLATSDPYVCVYQPTADPSSGKRRLGKSVLRTPVISGTLAPVWKESEPRAHARVNVPLSGDIAQGGSLVFEVWDHDEDSKNQFLGAAELIMAGPDAPDAVPGLVRLRLQPRQKENDPKIIDLWEASQANGTVAPLGYLEAEVMAAEGSSLSFLASML